MSIKLNITQNKLKSVGSTCGKKTLDSMILDKINNYSPKSSHGANYTAVQSAGYHQVVEGEEYDLNDLQGLLQREKLNNEAAPQPAAQEETQAPGLFQEWATPEYQDFSVPTYSEAQAEALPEVIQEAMPEAPAQYDFEIPVDEEFSQFEASILPNNAIEQIAVEQKVEEEVCESLSHIEAEVLRAQPDPEAPQACFEESELENGCPNVMRTRRGTIAFVRHEIGTYINPVYNKCGILVRVDLNGITLCRREGEQGWAIVDTQGEDILPTGIKAVYFDRTGNLITINSQGRKMMIGVDGTITNS